MYNYNNRDRSGWKYLGDGSYQKSRTNGAPSYKSSNKTPLDGLDAVLDDLEHEKHLKQLYEDKQRRKAGKTPKRPN